MENEAMDKKLIHENMLLLDRLMKAVDCCTFHGRDADNVATLRGWMNAEYQKSKNALSTSIESERIKTQPETAAA